MGGGGGGGGGGSGATLLDLPLIYYLETCYVQQGLFFNMLYVPTHVQIEKICFQACGI